MEKSATITKYRGTKYLTAKLNGENVKVIYYQNTLKALNNYCSLNKIKTKFISTPSSVNSILTHFKDDSPSSCKHYVNVKGSLKVNFLSCSGSKEPLLLLTFKGQIYVVKSISDVNRCDYCGTMYLTKHSCNARKAEYYHHLVNFDTKTWWEPIKFSPLGTVNTDRLYIIYDIETYTYHTEYGKQLVPYLLVFQLQGTDYLLKIANDIASKLNFQYKNGCFYILDKNSDIIGHSFKQFRTNLQNAATSFLWKDFCEKHQLDLEANFTYEQIQKLLKKHQLNNNAEPLYIEIIVLGHNISGFDEIVLASHTLDGIQKENKSMFKITRTFMPRAGKLLFNDVTFGLPNPKYTKPSPDTYKRWQKGILEPTDLKWQGVKFMVRDTYLLTHCSLRNAAEAYQLPCNKGHCPYEAVNEFLMTGQYEKDANGYPALKYWQNEKEYLENKTSAPYNILEQALKYCIDDVKVTSQLAQSLINGYKTFCKDTMKLECNFHIFQRPTISSNTHCMFRQVYYKNEKGMKDHLPNLQAPSQKMYDHIRKSIRGGRCYPSFLGVYNAPVYVYDICGMYASALTHPMPYGRTEDPFAASMSIKTFQSFLDNQDKISYFDTTIKPMIVYADCEPPPLEYCDTLPPFCSRKSGKLCWTNEPLYAEVMTTIDLITLHNRGWKCKILPNYECYAVWPEWKCICKDYVALNIAAKENADKQKNSTQRSISKLLSNALYGSFATKLDKKKVVFAADITEEDTKKLTSGKIEVTSQTTIISKALPKKDTSSWNKFFSNLPEMDSTDDYLPTEESTDLVQNFPFIESAGHVTFKPITHLNSDCDELILTVLEEKGEWIQNNRYPTQIAAFVLAWTRAFTSEWASILFCSDWGKPYENRSLKVLYGDTDSLFLTEEGHNIMISKGKYRLKSSGGQLVFDETNPKLTWLVECETMCKLCSHYGFAEEAVFLAPKLYALKNICCSNCNDIQAGKLRAKGHAKDCITYELLKACYIDHDLLLGQNLNYKTERKTMKRTLTTGTSTCKPFTVLEKQLVRILRPWKDKTMWSKILSNGGYLLFPYDKKHPNPRPQEPLTENPFWDDT